MKKIITVVLIVVSILSVFTIGALAAESPQSDSYSLTGEYVFKDVVSLPDSALSIDGRFYSYGISLGRIDINHDYIFYVEIPVPGEEYPLDAYREGFWGHSDYKTIEFDGYVWVSLDVYKWMKENTVSGTFSQEIPSEPSEAPITNITNIWAGIMEWLTETLSGTTGLFYDPKNGLTLIGTLSVIGISIGIVFLIIGMIQNFLHLRG